MGLNTKNNIKFQDYYWACNTWSLFFLVQCLNSDSDPVWVADLVFSPLLLPLNYVQDNTSAPLFPNHFPHIRAVTF